MNSCLQVHCQCGPKGLLDSARQEVLGRVPQCSPAPLPRVPQFDLLCKAQESRTHSTAVGHLLSHGVPRMMAPSATRSLVACPLTSVRWVAESVGLCSPGLPRGGGAVSGSMVRTCRSKHGRAPVASMWEWSFWHVPSARAQVAALSNFEGRWGYNP